jgi:tetratricopeptide (TPR) repeat protein
VPVLGRKKPQSRSQLLAAATKAQARGKLKKAAELYGEILRTDPRDPEVHRRIAPVLARLRRGDEAWRSFAIAARDLARSGFVDKAIGVYREAVHYLPRQVEAWLAIAEAHVEQGRGADAVQALLDGRLQFRSRKRRAEAIRLLSRAYQIEPMSLEPTLDLARLLRKTGDRRRAFAILESLRRRTPPSLRRRIRAGQLRIYPTPAALYRWLRGT